MINTDLRYKCTYSNIRIDIENNCMYKHVPPNTWVKYSLLKSLIVFSQKHAFPHLSILYVYDSYLVRFKRVDQIQELRCPLHHL